ncbi:hypothetical protein L1987_26354 [Smallanthus sonchifolius]|uniref:Uncharacterized protein n=1 Tax=Smallanthus sonchifolius TaxID=185202 RepID=A0ACB9IA58_9ASTR|nr:hypothetical protein L1987_26354 [Smallanthus sonchifolius]
MMAKLSKPSGSGSLAKQHREKKETPQERIRRIISKQLKKQSVICSFCCRQYSWGRKNSITTGYKEGIPQEEIKKAYHKLALRLHPNKNPDDENAKEKHQQLQKVVSILGDEGKHILYD